VTVAIVTSTDGATALSRMNLSGYAGHVTTVCLVEYSQLRAV